MGTAGTGVAGTTGAAGTGAAGTGAAGTGAAGTGAASMTGKFAVGGFDTFTGQGALYLQCAPDGTCFGNRGRINKLAPNGTAWTNIGDFTNGLVTASPSSMLRDSAGNLYTNACAGTPGVYKLPVGTTTWAVLGTGLTAANPTSCNWNTAAIDAAGTLYIGFATLKQLYKLPAGASAWVDTVVDLPDVVRSVVTKGNDVYVGHSRGVSVLKAGATEWTSVGALDDYSNANRLKFDGAGNLYIQHYDMIRKVAAGANTYQDTTGVKMADPSDIVFDADNNGYIVAAPSTGPSKYALMKLPAGTLTWTKLFDTTLTTSEVCGAMADDNIGHLVVQCQSVFLRSKP